MSEINSMSSIGIPKKMLKAFLRWERENFKNEECKNPKTHVVHYWEHDGIYYITAITEGVISFCTANPNMYKGVWMFGKRHQCYV